jgi:hypothetical protein
MKNRLLLFATFMALIISPSLYAQNGVSFGFHDGIEDGYLKRTMERNASRLLTAINIAEDRGGDIDYDGIDIDNLASQSIGNTWKHMHMRIVDDYIAERCLCIKSKSGAIIAYQTRNIKVKMEPLDDAYEGDLNQEVSIEFNRRGAISDFNITLGNNQYQDVFKEGKRLDDFDRRMQILHWVEQFRNAYIQKDINFMNAVFSDDALIITGKVITRTKTEMKRPTVKYTVQTKEQYLHNLSNVFASNRYVNVKFDSIKIVRHPTNPNFYDVTLIQNWHGEKCNGSVYADEGTVFLVWDFTDELRPQIHVRTWQPINDPNPIFKLSDFKI